jgi:hypothetical protein
MRLRLVVAGAVVALGLLAGVLGAGGAVLATGEEGQFNFYQAGEPLRHPVELIETTMIGKGAFDVDAYGRATGGVSGTIVYHESHTTLDDVDLTFSVDKISTTSVDRVGASKEQFNLGVKVAKSNDPGCAEGTRGNILLVRQGNEAAISIFICGRRYIYAGKTGKNSRLKVVFTKPQRCLTGLPACPAGGGQPTTVVPEKDLVGTYDAIFGGSSGTAEIFLSGPDHTVGRSCTGTCALGLTNQFGETAYGEYTGQTITVTSGAWPDVTSTHPLVGVASLSGDGHVVIQWGALLDGHGAGGSWTGESTA